ncbi:MAG: lysostaphin resistance A-like protein [Promethearchaeota archaeon]
MSKSNEAPESTSSSSSLEMQDSDMGSWQQRIAAITEVTGLYLIFGTLALLVLLFSGVDFGAVIPSGPNPDYLGASFTLLIILLIQYAFLLIPAFLIGWWHRRRPVKSYGVTRNSRPVIRLVLFGVVGFALGDLVFKLVKWAQLYLPFLGPIPPTQPWILTADWTHWGFWLYMAIGSFVLVPILEELFFRGYLQTRLAEDFGGPTAVLISSSIFTFGHAQFLFLSFFGISSVIAAFIGSLIFGYLYYRTKSLIPSILMHMLANIPLREPGITILLIVMIAIILVSYKLLNRYLREFWRDIRSIPFKWVAIGFSVYGAIFMALFGYYVTAIFIVGFVSLPLALILEFIEKRRLKAAR